MSKAHNPCMVEVLTMRLSDKQIVKACIINYSKTRNRDWLYKHQYWALFNGHGVQVTPVAADTHPSNDCLK